MKQAILVTLLSLAVTPVAAASPGGTRGNDPAPVSGPGTQSLPARSSGAGNLYLFLSNRKLDCTNESMEPDGELKNCALHVAVEVDGPVRYTGDVVVGCNAKFILHYLRAYHPITNSISRKVTVYVKSGMGKTVAALPVRRTGMSHSIVGFKLLKVDVGHLTCGIDSKS